MLARSQTQFLLSTCFEKSDNGNLTPKMLEFRVERQVIKGSGELAPQSQSMTISVPLLTLIPMNSLAIDELNIAFEMEVKSSTEYNHEDSSVKKNELNGDVTNPYHSDRFSCEMHGTLTNSRTDKSTGNASKQTKSHASYDISLHAGQLPLPNGLTTMIDMLTKGIAPIQEKD
jgi:hypothetical protein